MERLDIIYINIYLGDAGIYVGNTAYKSKRKAIQEAIKWKQYNKLLKNEEWLYRIKEIELCEENI